MLPRFAQSEKHSFPIDFTVFGIHMDSREEQHLKAYCWIRSREQPGSNVTLLRHLQQRKQFSLMIIMLAGIHIDFREQQSWKAYRAILCRLESFSNIIRHNSSQ
jgi:hypothetical protein